ncbi:hypothetical protein ACN08Y_00880 [Rothia sp. P5764]|uniref:hypothetical protein n=1 Tax=Rothia sp. P5764 TaxID=3402654 RepID=UPI003AC9882B
MGTIRNFRQACGSLMGVGALALGLVGCSASSSGTASDASSDSEIKAAIRIDPQAIEKVNTLFNMTPAAQQAKEAAIAQCMQAKGLTWPARLADQAFDIRSQFSPKPLSIEEAQQYGYQTQNSNPEQDAPFVDDATWDAYTGSPENGNIAVEGIPGAIAKDGCLAQSYKEVFGSVETGVLFESGILNLPLPYLNAAVADKRIVELDKQWATCMKDQHGLEIATPELAAVDTSMDSQQLAVYDAQCRQEVKYEEGATEVLNAYLTTFLADQQGVIDQLTQAKQTAEKNAPVILGK